MAKPRIDQLYAAEIEVGDVLFVMFASTSPETGLPLDAVALTEHIVESVEPSAPAEADPLRDQTNVTITAGQYLDGEKLPVGVADDIVLDVNRADAVTVYSGDFSRLLS